jgi:hypothetical protein
MNTITNTRPQPWPGGTSGGNNKRETYDQKYVGVDEQPPVKKVRLKRGALDGLVNQPGDVMYEVRTNWVSMYSF